MRQELEKFYVARLKQRREEEAERQRREEETRRWEEDRARAERAWVERARVERAWVERARAEEVAQDELANELEAALADIDDIVLPQEAEIDSVAMAAMAAGDAGWRM